MQFMGLASEDAISPILDTSPHHPFNTQWSLNESPIPVSRAPLDLRPPGWSYLAQFNFPRLFDVTSCPSLPPHRPPPSLLPSPCERGAPVPRHRPRPRPSRSKLLASLQPGRAAELRRARLSTEPGLAGTRLARGEKQAQPPPRQPSPAREAVAPEPGP